MKARSRPRRTRYIAKERPVRRKYPIQSIYEHDPAPKEGSVYPTPRFVPIYQVSLSKSPTHISRPISSPTNSSCCLPSSSPRSDTDHCSGIIYSFLDSCTVGQRARSRNDIVLQSATVVYLPDHRICRPSGRCTTTSSEVPSGCTRRAGT
jgi:hypothetical protein